MSSFIKLSLLVIVAVLGHLAALFEALYKVPLVTFAPILCVMCLATLLVFEGCFDTLLQIKELTFQFISATVTQFEIIYRDRPFSFGCNYFLITSF